mgnify:CR=1 FL=1
MSTGRSRGKRYQNLPVGALRRVHHMQVRCKQYSIPAKPTAAASKQLPFMSLPQGMLAVVQGGGSGCIIGAQNLKPPTVDVWHISLPGQALAAFGVAATAPADPAAGAPAIGAAGAGAPAALGAFVPAAEVGMDTVPPTGKDSTGGVDVAAPEAPAADGGTAAGVTAGEPASWPAAEGVAPADVPACAAALVVPVALPTGASDAELHAAMSDAALRTQRPNLVDNRTSLR